MAKLYPPQVESSIPAFYGKAFHIPFKLNRAVGRSEFNKVSAIIKTVSTGTIKDIVETDKIYYDDEKKQYYAEFEMDNYIPKVGQYYKIQLAFINKDNEIGFYSDTTITKCTAKPILYIDNLNDSININTYEYVGYYRQEADITEKVYSYCFELKDRNKNLVATSGWQIHDSSNDESIIESYDTWQISKSLIRNQIYYIYYSVNTLNNLTITSAPYIVKEMDTVDLDIAVKFYAENNYEEGSIILSLIGEPQNKKTITGDFVVSRRNISTDVWDEVYKFSILQTQIKEKIIWEDFTVVQGEEYEYAIQAHNPKGLYSNRLIAINKATELKEPIRADFEHAFLFDGERQLKIKYNPKVSTFKNTVLEAKIDTLGESHPFFFRNGNVKYKEFPISGLLSLIADNEEKFIKGVFGDDPLRVNTPSEAKTAPDLKTWLTSDNIYNERIFKLAVMEWLSDGKPKVFRSPTEGNYIVRLMNSSLTPNDTLGRMLHTFNCTAYEMAEFNYKNLVDLGFIKEQIIDMSTVIPCEINLKEAAGGSSEYILFSKEEMPNAYQVAIYDAIPDTVFALQFVNQEDPIQIAVGYTGTYISPIDSWPLYSITVLDGEWGNAKLRYNTPAIRELSYFSYIGNIEISDKIVQYIGKDRYDGATIARQDLLLDIEDANLSINITDENIDSVVEKDIRKDIKEIYSIEVSVRKQAQIYEDNNGKYYFDEKKLIEIKDHEWNPLTLYKIDDKYYNYIPGTNLKSNCIGERVNYNFQLGDNPIIDFSGNDLTNIKSEVVIDEENDEIKVELTKREIGKEKYHRTIGHYECLTEWQEVSAMYAGNGLIVDMAYCEKEIEYTVEYFDQAIIAAKNDWLNKQKTYEENLDNIENKKAAKTAYETYYGILYTEVQRIKREGGII